MVVVVWQENHKQEDWTQMHEVLQPLFDIAPQDRNVRVVSKVRQVLAQRCNWLWHVLHQANE